MNETPIDSAFINSPQVKVSGGPIVQKAKEMVNQELFRGVAEIVVVHTANNPDALGYVTNKENKSRVLNIVLARNIDQAKDKLAARYGKDRVATLPKQYIDHAASVEVANTIIHETGHVPQKDKEDLEGEQAAEGREKQNQSLIDSKWNEVFREIDSYLENDMKKAASSFERLVEACEVFEKLVSYS